MMTEISLPWRSVNTGPYSLAQSTNVELMLNDSQSVEHIEKGVGKMVLLDRRHDIVPEPRCRRAKRERVSFL